jgi:periplasmic divalent cation tolerance protein
MTDKKLVFTTAASSEEARKLARALLERRLVACVNILPQVHSIYRWQDAIEESEEWLLLIKTTEPALEQVRQTIRELHSYELPECVSIAIEAGSPEYLSWIDGAVG